MLFTGREIRTEKYFPEVSEAARNRRSRDASETEGKYFSSTGWPYNGNKTPSQAFTLTWKWRHTCYDAIDKNTNREPQANCMDFFKNKRPFRETYSMVQIYNYANEHKYTTDIYESTTYIYSCSLKLRCVVKLSNL